MKCFICGTNEFFSRVQGMNKIDLCDYVLVVNEDGYIGESTAREIAYAKKLGKPISYVFEGSE